LLEEKNILRALKTKQKDRGIKMKLTKLAIAITLLAIMMLGACTQSPTGKAVKQEEIKIGVLAPLTGAAGVERLGEYMRQSFDLAAEQINANGGIDGKRIKLLYEDTQCINLQATANALKKFKEIDQVAAVLGPYCGGPTEIAGKFSTDNHLLIVSSGDNLGKTGEYMITTRTRLAKEGELIAQYALKQGWKKIGIIHFTNTWGVTYRDSIKSYLESHGGKLIAAETYTYDNTDIRTSLLKIKEAGAQAIVLIDGSAGMLFKQVKELGIELPFMTEWEIENPANKGIALEATEGVKYFFPIYQVTSFHDKFREKYGYEPNAANINAYDAAMILANALKTCSDYNADCMINYITSLKDYPGAGGPMSFDKETWSFGTEFALKQVKDGKYVFVDE
jgi:branched-chain amino acid transport system substrate-binding protein